MAVSTITLRGLQQLIERIKRMVDPSAVIGNDDLVEAYNEYEEAIRETNERLNECDGLLREGHRSQALQRCELDPDLLQVVGILDFPERPLWHAILQEAGFSPPPAILLDVAAELNEAYNLEKPLADLMRLHRLHALAGSPLKTRLGFLRKIAQRDPATAFWRDDVRTYERARQLQIEQELLEVERSRNASYAGQLEKELATKDWSESPPRALIESAMRIHTLLRQAAARAQLKELALEIHESFAARDAQQATQYRHAWNGQMAIAQLPASDPLFEQVEPVFDWLDRLADQRQKERSYQDAVSTLETALNTSASPAQLEQYYNEITNHGDVPEELDARLCVHVQTLAGRSRLRFIAGSVLVIALVVVCTVAAVLYIQAKNLQADQQKHLVGLRALVQKERLADATHLREQIRKDRQDIATLPDFKQISAELDALNTAEAERKSALDQAIKTIEADLAEGSESRVESGGKTIRDIRTRKLAVTSPETEEIAKLDGRVISKLGGYQKARDAEFTKQRDEISPKVRALTEKDYDKVAAFRRELKSLQDTPRITSSLKLPLADIFDHLKSIEESAAHNRQRQIAIANVKASVGDLPKYIQELSAYAKAYEETSEGRSFAKLLESEQSLWRAVEPWNELVANWSQTDFARITPQQAKDLAAELQMTIQTHREFPAAKRLQELLPYLQAIPRRLSDSGSMTHVAIQELLANELITGLKSLISENKRYYLAKNRPEPQTTGLNSGEWAAYFYTDNQLAKADRVKVDPRTIKNPQSGNGFDWTSPQTKFARIANQKFDTLQPDVPDQWEPVFVQVLQELEIQKDMEPTLKLFLLKGILECGADGSHCLATGFAQWLQILKGLRPDIGANWINPEDELGKKEREKSMDSLSRLANVKAFDECRSATVDSYKRLRKANRGATYVWVGALLRDIQVRWVKDDQDRWVKDNLEPWVIESPKRPSDQTGTLVVLRNGENGTITAQPIGRRESGANTLEYKPASGMDEGRPVYLVKE